MIEFQASGTSVGLPGIHSITTFKETGKEVRQCLDNCHGNPEGRDYKPHFTPESEVTCPRSQVYQWGSTTALQGPIALSTT